MYIISISSSLGPVVPFGVDAGREAVDLSSQIWHRYVFFLDLMALRRSEPKM
jgi:hypothetical protein